MLYRARAISYFQISTIEDARLARSCRYSRHLGARKYIVIPMHQAGDALRTSTEQATHLSEGIIRGDEDTRIPFLGLLRLSPASSR